MCDRGAEQKAVEAATAACETEKLHSSWRVCYCCPSVTEELRSSRRELLLSVCDRQAVLLEPSDGGNGDQPWPSCTPLMFGVEETQLRRSGYLRG